MLSALPVRTRRYERVEFSDVRVAAMFMRDIRTMFAGDRVEAVAMPHRTAVAIGEHVACVPTAEAFKDRFNVLIYVAAPGSIHRLLDGVLWINCEVEDGGRSWRKHIRCAITSRRHANRNRRLARKRNR